jgi:hypothetical protein
MADPQMGINDASVGVGGGEKGTINGGGGLAGMRGCRGVFMREGSTSLFFGAPGMARSAVTGAVGTAVVAGKTTWR